MNSLVLRELGETHNFGEGPEDVTKVREWYKDNPRKP